MISLRQFAILAAVAIALMFAALGCASWSPQSTAFSYDTIGCAAPGASALVTAGIDDLVGRANGQPDQDWAKVGQSLATQYGTALAFCIVQAALHRFGPGSKEIAPPRALEAARWLDSHRAAWMAR